MDSKAVDAIFVAGKGAEQGANFSGKNSRTLVETGSDDLSLVRQVGDGVRIASVPTKGGHLNDGAAMTGHGSARKNSKFSRANEDCLLAMDVEVTLTGKNETTGWQARFLEANAALSVPQLVLSHFMIHE